MTHSWGQKPATGTPRSTDAVLRYTQQRDLLWKGIALHGKEESSPHRGLDTMLCISYSVTDQPVNILHEGVSMPDRLMLPHLIYVGQRGPDDQLPDISQLVTTLLTPRPSPVETHAQELAQHQTEIRRLGELADVIEQAVTALVVRLHMVSDPVTYEALQHSRADMQRFKDELVSLQVEHQRATLRLQSRT
jgi:hypothetical protein